MDWNRWPLAVVAAASLLAASPAVAQDETPLLAPTGGWSLNYDDDSCALVRSFGDADAPTLLELRQYSPSGPIVMTIADHRQLRSRIEPDVSFEPVEGEARSTPISQLDLGDGFNAVRLYHYSGIPEAAASALAPQDEGRDGAERAVQWLSVKNVFAEDFRLRTGTVNAAMNAFRGCLADLVTGWELDGEAHLSLSRRPALPEGEGWTVAALRRLSSSVVRSTEGQPQYMLMIVEADGSVSSCRALVASAATRLIEQVCEYAVENGEFDPALDAEGQPVRSYYVHGGWAVRPG